MGTLELEAEIFLTLAEKAWHRLPPAEQNSLSKRVAVSLMKNPDVPLPAHWQHDPLQFLFKSSGVVAVNHMLRPLILKTIATQFALHFATYEAAQKVLLKGGLTMLMEIQNRFLVKTATRGMAINTARYTAIRGIFAFLGPLLWGSLAVDLGWKAIETNYTRIIPIIFTLAQIRLTRGELTAIAANLNPVQEFKVLRPIEITPINHRI